jgi:DNA-binding transcriptional LysR family regulator
MAEMTLRQIEVIRAVMLTGTISGAADMLNVSAPGKGVENLHLAVGALQKGEDVRLAFASAPSIAQFIAARALRRVRGRFADLFIDLNILKIEETVDYLLLERGEFVIMSSPVANAAIENEQIADGRLVVILPEGHRLQDRHAISAQDLCQEELIGVDPSDPYGALLAEPFVMTGLPLRHAMRGRFAQTVVSLVRHGLGVAVIDEFSVAEVYMPGVVRRPLSEDVAIRTYVARKKGRVLSGFADFAIQQVRRELTNAIKDRPWLRRTK